MKHIIWWHGDGTVTVGDPHTGLRFDADQARRILVDALEAVTDQRAAEKRAA